MKKTLFGEKHIRCIYYLTTLAVILFLLVLTTNSYSDTEPYPDTVNSLTEKGMIPDTNSGLTTELSTIGTSNHVLAINDDNDATYVYYNGTADSAWHRDEFDFHDPLSYKWGSIAEVKIVYEVVCTGTVGDSYSGVGFTIGGTTYAPSSNGTALTTTLTSRSVSFTTNPATWATWPSDSTGATEWTWDALDSLYINLSLKKTGTDTPKITNITSITVIRSSNYIGYEPTSAEAYYLSWEEAISDWTQNLSYDFTLFIYPNKYYEHTAPDKAVADTNGYTFTVKPVSPLTRPIYGFPTATNTEGGVVFKVLYTDTGSEGYRFFKRESGGATPGKLIFEGISIDASDSTVEAEIFTVGSGSNDRFIIRNCVFRGSDGTNRSAINMGSSTAGSYLSAYNNTIYDFHYGIYIGGSSPTSESNYIVHNTITSCLHFGIDANTSNTIFYNNLLQSNGSDFDLAANNYGYGNVCSDTTCEDADFALDTSKPTSTLVLNPNDDVTGYVALTRDGTPTTPDGTKHYPYVSDSVDDSLVHRDAINTWAYDYFELPDQSDINYTSHPIKKITVSAYSQGFDFDWSAWENCGDMRLVVANGSSYAGTYKSDDKSLVQAWTLYTYDWTTDPSDSNPWTWTDINNLEIGVGHIADATVGSMAYCLSRTTKEYVAIEYYIYGNKPNTTTTFTDSANQEFFLPSSATAIDVAQPFISSPIALYSNGYGALTTDTSGGSVLVARGTPDFNFYAGVGDGSVQFANDESYYISNANLTTGFPGKAAAVDSDMSVSFYYMPLSSSESTPVSMWSAADKRRWKVVKNSDYTVSFTIRTAAADSTITTTSKLSFFGWYFITATYDKDSPYTGSIWIWDVNNNKLLEHKIANFAAAMNTTEQPDFGINEDLSGSHDYVSLIDEVKIYNVTLSNEEIPIAYNIQRDGLQRSRGKIGAATTKSSDSGAFEYIEPRDFYIDPAASDNSASGLSGYPWKDFSNLETTRTLNPGDKIYIKKGSTISDTVRLRFSGSSAANGNVTITGYDSGADPIIEAGTGYPSAAYALDLSSCGNLNITSLQINNGDTGVIIDQSFNITFDDVYITDDDYFDYTGARVTDLGTKPYAYDSRAASGWNDKGSTGIGYIYATHSGSNIIVKNSLIENKWNYGILIGSGSSNFSHSFTVDNCEIKNCGIGIAMINISEFGRSDYPTDYGTGVSIKNNYFHNNMSFAIAEWAGRNEEREMIIENNILDYNSNGLYSDASGSAGGIITFTNDIIIRYNSISNNHKMEYANIKWPNGDYEVSGDLKNTTDSTGCQPTNGVEPYVGSGGSASWQQLCDRSESKYVYTDLAGSISATYDFDDRTTQITYTDPSSVTVVAKSRYTGSSGAFITLVLDDGTNTKTSAAQYLTNAWANYSYTWNLAPDDTAWDWDSVNNLKAGFILTKGDSTHAEVCELTLMIAGSHWDGHSLEVRGSNNLVHNNVMYENDGAGLVMYHEGDESDPKSEGNKIYNNTFYRCMKSWVMGDRGVIAIDDMIDSNVRNNIFYTNSTGYLVYSREPNDIDDWTFDYNIWYSSDGYTNKFCWEWDAVNGDCEHGGDFLAWQAEGKDAHSQTIDPQVHDVSGAGFALLPYSVAVDGGVPLETELACTAASSCTTYSNCCRDYLGTLVPLDGGDVDTDAEWDIGACEWYKGVSWGKPSSTSQYDFRGWTESSWLAGPNATPGGDSQKGTLDLDDGEYYLGPVKDLGHILAKQLKVTVTTAVGGGTPSKTCWRGSNTRFEQTDTTPEWEAASTTDVIREWRYIQLAVYNSANDCTSLP